MRGSKTFLHGGLGPKFGRYFTEKKGGTYLSLGNKAGHDGPASNTTFKWRFAGGPIVTRFVYWPMSLPETEYWLSSKGEFSGWDPNHAVFQMKNTAFCFTGVVRTSTHYAR